MDRDLEALKRAVVSEPGSAIAWAELAQGYARAGRGAEAGPPADRAADLDPAFESLADEWGEWRTLGRNSSRSYDVPNSLLLPEPVRSLRERWRAPAGPALCPVVIAAGVAYSTEGREHLVARDLESGALRWRVAPPLEGGRPEQRWISSPSVASGLVVLSGHDWRQSAVWALDAETGALRWSWTSEPFEPICDHASATPVVSRQRVVSVWSGRVVALDLATGAERWVRDLETSATAPLAAWDGRVFVTASGRRTLLALDLTSGAELWASSTRANDLVTGLQVLGSEVVCLDYERSCYYSALDGARNEPIGLGEEYPQTACAGDLEVIVEGEDLVLIELPSDEEFYRLRLPGPAYAAPVIGPGTIAVGCTLSGEATLLVFSVS